MRRYEGQQALPVANTIVVGGQWGSEGKGAVIYEIGDAYTTHVRVGGPQAGHSVKLDKDFGEQVLKLQAIPVGAALGKECIIGMQSVVDPEVLEREIGWFDKLGVPLQLAIDPRATILDPAYRRGEKNMVDRIGSTGKGVGFARAERIMRNARTVGEYVQAANPSWAYRVTLAETDWMIRQRLDSPGKAVLVEAAQGIQLSLFSSGYYPYVTSSEATPTGVFAEMGLPLQYARDFEMVGVFRTYPIRVAGQSGPLPNETTWEAIEAERGASIDEEEKTTTVTRKTRRVAEWDAATAHRSVVQHGLNWAVLSFLDYVYPEVAGETNWDRLGRGPKQYVSNREEDLGIPIKAVGTGFGTYAWRQP